MSWQVFTHPSTDHTQRCLTFVPIVSTLACLATQALIEVHYSDTI